MEKKYVTNEMSSVTLRVRIVHNNNNNNNNNNKQYHDTYSVLAVFPNHYTVSGYELPSPSPSPSPLPEPPDQRQLQRQRQRPLDYVLPIKYSGNYQIFVHKIQGGKGRNVKNILLHNSPINLPIQATTTTTTTTATKNKNQKKNNINIPSCHAMRDDSLTKWDVHWIGPNGWQQQTTAAATTTAGT